jgi:hypothetical protein
LFKRYSFLTLAAAAALTACTEASSIVEPDAAAFAKAPTHRVTGSGVALVEDLTVRFSVNVFEDKGSIDVTTGEGSAKMTVSGSTNCLSVDGNTAWITATVTKSSDQSLVPLGATYLVVITDDGDNDLVFGDVVDPSVLCTSHPAAPMVDLISGRFTVR